MDEKSRVWREDSGSSSRVETLWPWRRQHRQTDGGASADLLVVSTASAKQIAPFSPRPLSDKRI